MVVQCRIVDMAGIGMTDLGPEALNFVKQIGNALGHNYPERQAVIYVVNVPTYFNLLWRMVAACSHSTPSVNLSTRRWLCIPSLPTPTHPLVIFPLPANHLTRTREGSCNPPGCLVLQRRMRMSRALTRGEKLSRPTCVVTRSWRP